MKNCLCEYAIEIYQIWLGLFGFFVSILWVAINCGSKF